MAPRRYQAQHNMGPLPEDNFGDANLCRGKASMRECIEKTLSEGYHAHDYPKKRHEPLEKELRSNCQPGTAIIVWRLINYRNLAARGRGSVVSNNQLIATFDYVFD
jgi:hypothetical protein